MRGETAVENGVEGVEHGGNSAPTETTNGEKRPSVAMLKNMLENSPRNLFQHDYNNGVQKHLHSSSQNGASGDSTRSNPFYLYHLESVNKSHLMEANEWKSSGVANGGIFIPPPDYESSPFERTVEDKDKFSEPLSPSQTNKHEEKLFRTNIMDQSATAIGFRDTTLKSPKTISRNAAPTQNSSKTWHQNGYNYLKDGANDYLNTAKREELIHTEYPQEVVMLEKSPNVFVDPFKSPSNEIQSPRTVATNLFYHTKAAEPDLFQAGSTKHDKLSYGQENKEDTSYEERDIFGEPFNKTLDIFSSSSVTSVDPFPSPLSRNLFNTSSLDDPFGPTPSKQQDPFQDVSNGTPDIFQPQFKEAKKSKDIFEMTSSTSLNNSPTNVKLSTPASTDLPKKTPRPPPPYRPKRSNTLKGLELTTPQESKQDPLQSTPFSQSISPSASPSPSPTDMTHVSTFKRPPKPLPRTRHHRPEMPPKPERPPLPEIFVSPITQLEPKSDELKSPPKPLFKLPPKPPKPVIRLKPKTPDIKPVNPENYVVFEDVLLTGQERCVEDWPEDSPEINPDFKPPGKFKLRRESMKVKIDSDGGSSEELDGSGDHTKKKNRKMRRPLLSMRRLKDKFPDDTMDAKSNTLPIMQKSSKDEENEDDYYSSMDLKKKSHTKAKVNNLFRRASSGSFGFDGKHKNRKNSDTDKTDNIGRRHSEAMLYNSYTEEEEKKKGKVKVKFVPQRGFAITRGKPEDEPKGGYGLTPRKGSKDKSLEELGAYGFTPCDKSKDFEDEEEMEDLNLELAAKGAFMDDEHLKKPRSYSPIPNGDIDGIQDRKHHKKSKIKIPSVSRRSSKENMLDDSSMQKKKSSFSAEELDDEEFYGMEDCKLKNSKQKAPAPAPRKPRRANKLREGGSAEDIGDMKSPEEMYDEEQDDLDLCKPKKQFKLKVPKKFKHKSKAMPSEGEGPAGGHLSEAAKAEWMAAQKDGGGMEGLEEEDDEEDGDTDSLMEWWYTVEQWDELPSDEEDAALKEDESKSFTILAYKVERGLRVFNKVFTEQAEALWEYLITLHALADDISEFHHKAKIAGITGGTTTAVGSVAAITGLALAPLTLGASLVITAVGVGVATAGGITSASAAISDNVNNMQDRKKIETVLKDYEDRMLDIAKVLHFINQGLVKLRGHPFLRSGTQHYSQDWEVRNAVQIISLVDSPVMKATEITDDAVASLQGLFKGMDKFFTKDTRELKKGCKKEIVGEIRHVANVLNDCIMDLNEIREDLQKATGS
ncbi:uncharacterized protein si:cabz01007807.1 isoform X2 [Kryptolebias marmoratus]|uniref:uncharacterized protein si:cabz01007807.1 isoform X2 n=1 Tax=Kryptolebias marmoratus TaxID=37003 RepID=UPI000D52FF7F|nr:uncharacterized protein si:cabz01007807.1 isoform X2 [Kryptolebias marmoratus]